MRDDEIRGVLRDVNPWWSAHLRGLPSTAWAADDPALRRRAKWDLGFRTTILADIATGPLTDGLYVLRGPRRVGKSVAMKDLVVNLLERDDVDSRQVIYFAADTLTAQDLRRYFAVGRAVTATVSARRIWLVDEVTAVPDWTRLLKELRDTTALAGDCLIVSGSSALESVASVRDLGAGRTGAAHRPFRTLLPMSFADYVAVRSSTISAEDRLEPYDLMSEQARDLFGRWSVLAEELDVLWQDYLECGGFPRAAAEHAQLGGVSQDYVSELAAWLRTDVDPEGPSESVALLLDQLTKRTAAPLNVRNTADVLGVGRDRFERRLARMRTSYAAIWCPRRRNGQLVAGAQSKLYLTDPLLAHLPSWLRPGLDRPDASKLSEGALGVAIARSLTSPSPLRWEDGETIGYHRHTTGTEVDFAPVPAMAPSGGRYTVAIESKWVSRGWQRESNTIRAAFGQGIIATKNVTDLDGDVWAVPAPTLALLMRQ